MKLIIDKKQRFAKQRAHTATHLLHYELSKILPQTKQAGSFVDGDYLRFDFQSNNLLDPQKICKIEENINQIIYDSYNIEIGEYEFNEAIKLGAKAFFDDKYGKKVRIVQIKDHNNDNISIELCGGTHVSNTREIGVFCIISQEAVASGIKRITALTGPQSYKELKKKNLLISQIANIFKSPEKQLKEKIKKFQKEHEILNNKFESLQSSIIQENIIKFEGPKNKFFDKIINTNKINYLKDIEFKIIGNTLKSIEIKGNILLLNDYDNYFIKSSNKKARQIANSLNLKGGGNEFFFQGKDNKIKNII